MNLMRKKHNESLTGNQGLWPGLEQNPVPNDPDYFQLYSRRRICVTALKVRAGEFSFLQH